MTHHGSFGEHQRYPGKRDLDIHSLLLPSSGSVSSMSELPQDSSFPTTRWSIIFRSRDTDCAARSQATEEICRTYWPPVYAFLRASGYSQHDAEDFTQGFFEHLLASGGFDRTDPAKGKLRSYLLGALKNHLAAERRRASRKKRGGGVEPISWSQIEAEGAKSIGPVDVRDPDTLYTRRWVTSILEQVLEQLRVRYVREDKEELFEALKPSLMPGGEICAYALLAKRLGMTESAVKVAAHRLRQRFGVRLRETVSFTMEPGGDVDQEIRELMASFQ